MTAEAPASRALPHRYGAEALTPEQVERIHHGALEISERTGIATNVEAKRALAPRAFTVAGPRPERDLAAITRLADALPEIGFLWRSVSARDTPSEVRSLHEVEVRLNSTTKRLQTGAGDSFAGMACT
jgi:trimethylamine:corrinoid methyltransferase-like protein